MFRLAAKSTSALVMRSTQTMRPATQLVFRAGFSAAAGALSKDTIKSRVLEVLSGFEKVDATKVRSSLFSTRRRPVIHHDHEYS